MINLRYHIVSITAVFLALAIGIAMGTTFIDRATVSTLKARLDDLSGRIDASQDDNRQLRAQLDSWRAIDEEFAAEALPLLDGTLAGVPVLIMASKGVDTDDIDQVRGLLAAAGGQLQGTLWLTERLLPDEPGDVAALAGTLDLAGAGVDRLQEEIVTRLSGFLAGPTTEVAGGEPGSEGGATTSTSTTEPDPRVEHLAALSSLVEDGFIEIEEVEGGPSGVEALVPAGTRFLVISGPGAELVDAELVVPVLTQLVAVAPGIPVVAAQGMTDEASSNDVGNRTSFVGPLRDDERLKNQVSTVDDLDLSMGRFATVLALASAGRGEVGHYGIGAGHQTLFPLLGQG